MQQAQDGGRRDAEGTAGQAASARNVGSDEKIEYEHPIGAGSEPAEGTVAPGNDATGGEAWNRSLGGNTSAGMRRMLVAVGLFILIGASLLWLIAA